MKRCPLCGNYMAKRLYIIIQGNYDSKRVDFVCQYCNASLTDYNGVTQLFNGHGLIISTLPLPP